MIYLKSDKLARPHQLRSPFCFLQRFPCLCLCAEVIVFNKYISSLQLNLINDLTCKEDIVPTMRVIQR